MKKIGAFIFLFLFASSFLIPFVSANAFTDGVVDVLEFAFGGFENKSTSSLGVEILFIKFLVFILLLAIINSAVQNIPRLGENTSLAFIISLIVSLIAVRYLTNDYLIDFIWLPYGVLGIALSSFLPFIIGFFFIEGFDSTVIRKVGWVTYLVIFTGLAYVRWDELFISGHNEWYYNLALIYAAIAVISALLLIFDKNIHAMFLMSSLNKMADRTKRIEAIDITEEIKELRSRLRNASAEQMRDLKEEIALKKKQLKNLMTS